MTRYYTKIVQEWDETLQKYVTVSAVESSYVGDSEQLKKGREAQAQITQADQNRAATNDAYTAQQRGALGGILSQDVANSKPGSLAPAAAAQLASDQNNIANTYNGMRETAYGSLGQRGFGGAPSGFEKGISNGINQGQANADTGAFRNAQQNTQNLSNFAAGQYGGQANSGANAAQAADNGGSQSAYDQSKMGSTVGDITGAIAQVAPIAAAPFTGGASLGLSGLMQGASASNPFANLGKSGSTPSGGYGGYGA
jgi:hypothetical protein